MGDNDKDKDIVTAGGSFIQKTESKATKVVRIGDATSFTVNEIYSASLFVVRTIAPEAAAHEESKWTAELQSRKEIAQLEADTQTTVAKLKYVDSPREKLKPLKWAIVAFSVLALVALIKDNTPIAWGSIGVAALTFAGSLIKQAFAKDEKD